MFGVKLVSESNKEFFKFESVRCDLVLLLIIFIDENVHMYMSIQNGRDSLGQIFFVLRNLRKVKLARNKLYHRPLVLRNAHHISFSIWNLFLSQLVPFVLLSIFNISCSLSENGFRNVGM